MGWLLISLTGGIMWVGTLVYWIVSGSSALPSYQIVIAAVGGTVYLMGALMAAKTDAF